MIESVPLDTVSQKILTLLRQQIDEEPPEPDPQEHTGPMLDLVARRYERWVQITDATRLLLGVRLVSAALRRTEELP